MKSLLEKAWGQSTLLTTNQPSYFHPNYMLLSNLSFLRQMLYNYKVCMYIYMSCNHSIIVIANIISHKINVRSVIARDGCHSQHNFHVKSMFGASLHVTVVIM